MILAPTQPRLWTPRPWRRPLGILSSFLAMAAPTLYQHGRSRSAAAGGGTYRDEVMADSPVGYWRLGESSGTTATDESGNGNHGTYLGSPSLGAAGAISGDADTAVLLDGVDDNVSVPNAPSLNPTSAITVSGWIYPTDLTGMQYPCLVEKGHDTGWTFVMKYGAAGVASTFARVVIGIGGIRRDFTWTWALPLDAWSHVAFTFDGSTIEAYLNGASVASSSAWSGSLASNTDEMRIGHFEAQGYFKGRIDEVSIFGAALSLARIQAHYNKGIGA